MTASHQSERSGARSVLRWVLVAVGLIAFYLLAYGPALSLAQRQVIPLRFVLRAYRPLPMSFQQQYLWYYARLDSRCYRIEYSGPP
jgi:hypothetical protein